MVKADCIIPTGDGCSAICTVDAGFSLDDEAVVSFRYESDGLLVDYSGIEVKVPTGLFAYLQQETLVEDEELGWITNVHLYGRSPNDYLASFLITVPVFVEEFIKAKGVAEYLASNPKQ